MPDNEFASSSEPIVLHVTIRNEPVSEPPKSSARLGGFSTVVDLVKGIAWPLLAVMFFFMFRDPIRRVIVLVPDKLERADKGNIGSLSWEIQQRAKEQGGNDLAVRVGTLSPAAIEELISTPRYGSMGFVSSYMGPDGTHGFTIPSTARLNGFRELESAQLIKFREPLDVWLKFVSSVPVRDAPSVQIPYGRTVLPTHPLSEEQLRRINFQSYELTPRGVQAVEATVKALGEQLRSH